jgi:sec-independent protein translocase protein TatB
VFDVSFSELMVIAVVALIVIGPEKLPKVARTLGALTGRMQRYVAQVKEEVNREVRFEELQQLQQEIKESATTAQANFQRKTDELAKNLTQDLDFQDSSAQNLSSQDSSIKDKEVSKEALNKV